MKISYNWLQSHFNEKLPKPPELAELLTMHSQEVDDVEERDGDFDLEVKVLPDRAHDYINYLGVIKDIAATLRLNAKISSIETKERKIIFVKGDNFEKILGIQIPEKEIIDILQKLGMEVIKKDDLFTVRVPPERPDIKIKEDVIEEVARIYGYEKIEETTPEGLLVSPKRNNNLFFANIARNILTGLGYDEMYNYSFSKNGYWEIENPPSKDKKFLRNNLTDGLLISGENNSKYFKDIKIFELGKTFPTQGERLSLGALNNQADFHEMKGVADIILGKLGLNDFFYKEHDDKKSAEVCSGNKIIGRVTGNSFEFNFDELINLADEAVEYKPISKYPAVIRDIAIFVPLNEKAENVLNIIRGAAGEFLVETDLFDIYENEEKKSLAFHLTFQSLTKTLTDDEVNEARDKIFKNIETNSNWKVRK